MANRKVMLQFRIDRDLLDAVDKAVLRSPEIEGNRSQFIRRALAEKLARSAKARPVKKEAA